MSRSLHRTLILGCLGLAALYARPAWDSLSPGVPEAALAVSPITPAQREVDRVGAAPESVRDREGAAPLVLVTSH